MALRQSTLASKYDATEHSRKNLVLKKSKLGVLSIGWDKEKTVLKIFPMSSVAFVPPPSAFSRGGFKIYVDPTIDPDFGEIVIVKKKKSHVALDGMSWDALGEATNVPKFAQVKPQPVTKENPAMLKVKAEEERKWWSIGQERKNSKEQEKGKGKENKISTNIKCMSTSFSSIRIDLSSVP